MDIQVTIQENVGTGNKDAAAISCQSGPEPYCPLDVGRWDERGRIGDVEEAGGDGEERGAEMEDQDPRLNEEVRNDSCVATSKTSTAKKVLSC